MASRAGNFGIDRELAAKQEAKYNPALEEEARKFVCLKTGAAIAPGKGCLAALKDGVLLCKMMNALRPGLVPKINTNKMPFMMMENIGHYLRACEAYGIRSSELFQTVDLFEEQNMNAVVLNILAVARQSGFSVQVSGGSAHQVDVVEKPYQAPLSSAPVRSPQGGHVVGNRGGGDVPLLLAGAMKAGEATKGAFTPGRRDIKAYQGDVKVSGETPLLQEGAARAMHNIKGAFTPGSHAEIVKTNGVNYGGQPAQASGEVPRLQQGAMEAGQAAVRGAHGVGIGPLIDKYSGQK